MTIPLSIKGGTTRNYPQNEDEDYGTEATLWAQDVTTAVNNTPLATNVAQYDVIVSSTSTRRTHATLELAIADAAVTAGMNVLIDSSTFTQNSTLNISKALNIYGLGNSTFEAGPSLGANPIIQISTSNVRFQEIKLDANSNSPTYAVQVDAAVTEISLDIILEGTFATGDIDNQSTAEAIVGSVTKASGNYLLPTAGTTYANTELSNLASGLVAINDSLTVDADNAYDLGSDAKEYKDVYAYSLQHGDSVSPNLNISTNSDDGDIILTPDGSGKTTINNIDIVGGTIGAVTPVTEATVDNIVIDGDTIKDTTNDLILEAEGADTDVILAVNGTGEPRVKIDSTEYQSSYSVPIIDYTTVGEVGDSDQIMAGHNLTADIETLIGGMVAIYNLSDNTDLSGNSNTLDDADAYNAGNGIFNVASTAYLGVNGEHLQADAITGFSGTGDLDCTIGGWHKSLASGGLLGVGTNAATQKMQYYTDANGYVIFDIAGVTCSSISVVTGSWIHIVFIYDKTNSLAYGYVNGRCECCFSATSNLDIQASPSVWINSKTDGTLEVASYSDECFIYEGVLSYRDIILLMSVKIAEPTILASKEYDILAKIQPEADTIFEYQKLLKVLAKYNAYIYQEPFLFGTTDKIKMVGRL